jgi:hypothetical protein
VPGVKESYHNFKILFDLLQLHHQPHCKLLMDLKAGNLSLGMQSARARYDDMDHIHM